MIAVLNTADEYSAEAEASIGDEVFTPVKEIAPQKTLPISNPDTTILFAPVAGLTKYHI